MNAEIGLSISFRWNRIRFRTQLIECIGNPEYIHLLIDRENKLLYVQACERDKDAFKVYFQKTAADIFQRGVCLLVDIGSRESYLFAIVHNCNLNSPKN